MRTIDETGAKDRMRSVAGIGVATMTTSVPSLKRLSSENAIFRKRLVEGQNDESRHWSNGSANALLPTELFLQIASILLSSQHFVICIRVLALNGRWCGRTR